jgi:DNA-binding LytR/AlgR family response regulator
MARAHLAALGMGHRHRVGARYRSPVGPIARAILLALARPNRSSLERLISSYVFLLALAIAEYGDQQGTRPRVRRYVGAVVRLITVEEICYFQLDTKYTRAVTADSEVLIRKPLKELSEELDPSVFWQIHRSTIVNVNAIASVDHDIRGHLMLRLRQRKETLAVSQSYAHLFRQM